MSRIDTMQVCRNGHYITDRYHSKPKRRENHCSDCGAETIIACQECGTEIEGDDIDSSVVVMATPNPPDHCSNCGATFPWASPKEPGDLTINLPNEFFDEELAERCFHHFDDEDYQDAIQNAFIVLEERIRKEAGMSQDKVGEELCKEAFSPDGGSLATGDTGGEKAGVQYFFRGIFLAFRNASHHRFMDEEHLDQKRAYSLLCTINMLLNMAEEAGE